MKDAIITRRSSSSDNELFNFPLTISKTEPTNPEIGHIWVDTDKTFSNIHIVNAILENEPNDTLILVTTNSRALYFAAQAKKTLKNSNMSSANIKVDPYIFSSPEWTISDIDTSKFVSDIRLSNPRVYSKENDIVDMEDAYIYTDIGWAIISKNSSYMVISRHGTTSPESADNNPAVYNIIGDDLTYVHTPMTTPTSAYSYCKTFSNPEYIFISSLYNTEQRGIYKRKGDLFELYFQLPINVDFTDGTYPGIYSTERYSEINMSTYGSPVVMNSDGTELLVVMYKPENWGTTRVVRYVNNGTTFALSDTVCEWYNGSIHTLHTHSLNATHDLSYVHYGLHGATSDGYGYGTSKSLFKNIDGSYKATNPWSNSYYGQCAYLSPTGDCLFSVSQNGSYYYVGAIDYEGQTVRWTTVSGNFASYSNYSYITRSVYPKGDGHLWLAIIYYSSSSSSIGTIYLYKMSSSGIDNSLYLKLASDDPAVVNCSDAGVWGKTGISFSQDGKYMFLSRHKYVWVYEIEISENESAFSVTHCNTITISKPSVSSGTTVYQLPTSIVGLDNAIASL